MSQLFSVQGKVALVTGGTSGIGYMIAKALVEHGAVTYIVGRDKDRCQVSADELTALGECRPLPGDISSLEGVNTLVNDFKQQQSQLDILVNNAGAMYEAPLDEFSEAGWDSVVDLNLKAVFFLTQELLPLLRVNASDEQASSVINIGSVGGLRVGPKENYSYQAAKAGLHHLTGSLAKRLGVENITVNAIAPGFFPSAMTQIPEEVLPEILKVVPRSRVGSPDDIAGAVIYLASKAGSFVTGAVIPVAGGMTL